MYSSGLATIRVICFETFFANNKTPLNRGTAAMPLSWLSLMRKILPTSPLLCGGFKKDTTQQQKQGKKKTTTKNTVKKKNNYY